MGIQGSGLKSSNARLRFLVIIFFGIVGLAGVLFWRTKTFESAEKTGVAQQKEAIKGELKSENYQVEVQDTSPTAQ